jgi:hypothetical protein
LIVSFAIAAAHRNSRARAEPLDRGERSQQLRAAMRALQKLRARGCPRRCRAGTCSALQPAMAESKSDAWTISLLVILWTSWLVGLIMIMVVVLMH